MPVTSKNTTFPSLHVKTASKATPCFCEYTAAGLSALLINMQIILALGNPNYTHHFGERAQTVRPLLISWPSWFLMT